MKQRSREAEAGKQGSRSRSVIPRRSDVKRSVRKFSKRSEIDRLVVNSLPGAPAATRAIGAIRDQKGWENFVTAL